MRVVKDLTRSSNITICATIHSPTPAIFHLFDNMMILLRGQMAYYGSAGLLTSPITHALHVPIVTLDLQSFHAVQCIWEIDPLQDML